MSRISLALACTLVSLVALPGAERVAGQADTRDGAYRFALRIHRDSPGAADPWMDQQLAMANRVYEAAGIQFVLTDRDALGREHARIESLYEILELAIIRANDRTGVDVFVVDSIEGIDPPDTVGYGVAPGELDHLRRPGDWSAPSACVLLVPRPTFADRPLLAHELGHFFALAHTERSDDVMRRADLQRDAHFDEAQIAALRATAATYAANHRPAALTDGS